MEPLPEHLIPIHEQGMHADDEDCSCKPFIYVRRAGNKMIVSREIRHNSFDALPVDEEALERIQHGE